MGPVGQAERGGRARRRLAVGEAGEGAGEGGDVQAAAAGGRRPARPSVEKPVEMDLHMDRDNDRIAHGSGEGTNASRRAFSKAVRSALERGKSVFGSRWRSDPAWSVKRRWRRPLSSSPDRLKAGSLSTGRTLGRRGGLAEGAGGEGGAVVAERGVGRGGGQGHPGRPRQPPPRFHLGPATTSTPHPAG